MTSMLRGYRPERSDAVPILLGVREILVFAIGHFVDMILKICDALLVFDLCNVG